VVAPAAAHGAQRAEPAEDVEVDGTLPVDGIHERFSFARLWCIDDT
jgi:hypothetical protein